MAQPSLEELVALRWSRRDVLKFGTASSLTSLLGLSQNAYTTIADVAGAKSGLGFKSVPISSADTVVVPEGYTSRVFFAWGDPISDGPSFKPDASNTAADQAVQAGMHHDGMHFFSLPPGSNNPDHGLLVVNHEYLDQRLLYPDGMLTWTVGFAGRLAFPYGTARLRNYGPDIYAGRQNGLPEYPASRRVF